MPKSPVFLVARDSQSQLAWAFLLQRSSLLERHGSCRSNINEPMNC